MDITEIMTIMTMTTKKATNEKCLVITGTWHTDFLWSGRGRWQQHGHPTSVSFANIYDRVISRESTYGDVIGFYHTHPQMPGIPSSTDIQTMNQWVDVMGKDLLCLIHGQEGIQTYLWVGENDFLRGKTLKIKDRFMGGIYGEV